jgi:hypothetical protein
MGIDNMTSLIFFMVVISAIMFGIGVVVERVFNRERSFNSMPSGVCLKEPEFIVEKTERVKNANDMTYIKNTVLCHYYDSNGNYHRYRYVFYTNKNKFNPDERIYLTRNKLQ